MDFTSQFLQDDAVATTRAVFASGFCEMLLTGFCKVEQSVQATAIFYTLW